MISLKGNQVEIHKTEGGDTSWAHMTDVKYILLADSVIKNVLDYQNFGRKTTLRLNPDKIPNLNWNLAKTLNTTPTLTTQQSVMQIDINLCDIIPCKVTCQQLAEIE